LFQSMMTSAEANDGAAHMIDAAPTINNDFEIAFMSFS
jgi:hypothetical protein